MVPSEGGPSIDRDPFEWAYDTNGDGIADLGSPTAIAAEGYDLVSGPRWRMKSNKFGQDIPGLEIPATRCDPPPYDKGTVKYEVGEVTETHLNLLDWAADNPAWDDAVSPFAYSAGWTNTWSPDDAGNPEVTGMQIQESERCAATKGENCVTDLGTELTEGLDVAFYVKGDQKPLKVYDVQVVIEYESDDIPVYESDFGDAPASYGTESESRIVDGTYLGATVDSEAAAWVSDDALGDDSNGVDDEDGVTVPKLRQGKSALIKVRASGPGTLVAWFDFNGNGVFDTGALQGEAFGPFVVEEGINQFATSVPAGAEVGDTFARFRLSSDAGAVAEPTGEAPDGEVEDYLVTVDRSPGKPSADEALPPEEDIE